MFVIPPNNTPPPIFWGVVVSVLVGLGVAVKHVIKDLLHDSH